jgi:L-seryl-tRNA(Ser) seleniumtransferase
MTSRSILEELGIKKIVNAHGSLTVLGGSTVSSEVLDAMREVAGIYVDMPDLHLKAGEKIAELLGSEAAYVVSGAGAGLVLAAAACMIRKVNRSQDPRDLQTSKHNQILVQKLHRNMYDYLPQIAGAKLAEYGLDTATSEKDLEEAISENTVAVLHFVYDPQPGVLPLERVLEIAHSRGLPVIVDAAAEIPPAENLSKFVALGADVVLFSGGKDLGAPNDTGLLLGRKDIVDLCRSLGPQSYATVGGETRIFIGRPMKTSKEDIVGVIAALEKYLKTDHTTRIRNWDRSADYFVSRINAESAGNATATKVLLSLDHPRPATIPKVEVALTGKFLSPSEVLLALKEEEPQIYAYSENGRVCVNPQCLDEEEVKLVADRLIRILRRGS